MTLRQLQLSKKPEKLSKFRGGATEWFYFWHQFKTLVDDNAKLTTLVKYQKLRDALEGKPKQTVAQFPFGADSYEDAKKALENEFGNKQEIATQLLRNLESHPYPKQGDVDSYRAFTNTLCQTYNFIDMYIKKELYRADRTHGMLVAKLHANDRHRYLKDYETKVGQAETDEERAQLEDYKIKFFKEWMTKATEFLERSHRLADHKPLGFSTGKREQATAGTSGGGKPQQKFDKNRRKNKPFTEPQSTYNFTTQATNPPNTNNQRGGGNSRGRGGRGGGRGGQASRGRGGGPTGGSGRGRGNAKKGDRGTYKPQSTPASGPAADQGQSMNAPSKQNYSQKPRQYPPKAKNRCQNCFSEKHDTTKCQVANRDFLDPVMLRTTMLKVRPCLNCNQGDHTEEYCPHPPKCLICYGYHSTNLHRYKMDEVNVKPKKAAKKDNKA